MGGSAEAAVVGRGSPLSLLMPGWTERFLNHLHLGLQEALNSEIWFVCAYTCHCASTCVVSAPAGSVLVWSGVPKWYVRCSSEYKLESEVMDK